MWGLKVVGSGLTDEASKAILWDDVTGSLPYVNLTGE